MCTGKDLEAAEAEDVTHSSSSQDNVTAVIAADSSPLKTSIKTSLTVHSNNFSDSMNQEMMVTAKPFCVAFPILLSRAWTNLKRSYLFCHFFSHFLAIFKPFFNQF